MDSLEVVILEFGRVLWFGNRIEKLMMNPNQCWKFGIQICDESTDPHRKLLIEVSEDLFILMVIEGLTCGVIIHPPTNNGLQDCQRIIILDEFGWYPPKNLFEFLQWSRSTGQAQIFIATSISFKVEFQVRLQLFSVEKTWGFMILEDQWHVFPLD